MSQILSLGGGGGGGTVTSIAAGTGITLTPNPIVGTGTVALTIPVSPTVTDGVVYYDGTSLVTTAVGSATQVLTSNGVGLAPTFQPAASGVTLIGDAGSAISGSSLNIFARPTNTVYKGNTWTFTGSGTTLTLTSTNVSNNTITGGSSFQGAFVQPTGTLNSIYGSFILSSGNSFSAITANSNALFGFSIGVAGSLSNPINYSQNSVFGIEALQASPTGSSIQNNCVVGYSAMGNSVATTSSRNCIFGSQSSQAMISASDSVAIGYQSLKNITLGTNLICLGSSSGASYTTSESFNIIIGAGDVISESNKTKIGYFGGSPTQTGCFIDGIDGVTVTGAAVLVATGGQLGVAVSSAKYKDNIQDMAESSSKVLDLRPVTFSYKGGNDTHFGLIAEEVNEVLPELVVYDSQGLPQTVMYHELPAMLLNELKKALKRIEALEARG